MPVVRVVPETIPSEWNVMKDIEAGIGAVMDDVVDAQCAWSVVCCVLCVVRR